VWFRKNKPDRAVTSSDLRDQLFASMPGEFGIAPGPGHQHVWFVLMETGYPEASASLVAVADGTTSLYFSNGGGIIGAGEHPAVRNAAERFIALVDARVGLLTVADAHPLPSVGRVRFYARTFTDLRTAEAAERELGEGQHPLSPLFFAGHAVITAVRNVSPPE
jgi:hypothetical protein